jgi:hypothetical protein
MVNITQPPRYADGSILIGGALPRCREALRFSVIEPWHCGFDQVAVTAIVLLRERR